VKYEFEKKVHLKKHGFLSHIGTYPPIFSEIRVRVQNSLVFFLPEYMKIFFLLIKI